MSKYEATGSLQSATISSPASVSGPFNLTIFGTFSGAIRLVRSFNNGVNWYPVTYIDGSTITWTSPMSTYLSESENGVLYALEGLSGFSGTANWRISQ